MKLRIMENALDTYANRFQLTMMAVARAKEINEGEKSLVVHDDQTKPVVLALQEIAEGLVVPSSHGEMNKVREAKRILKERVLMEAQENEVPGEAETDESYASAHSEGGPLDS